MFIELSSDIIVNTEGLRAIDNEKLAGLGYNKYRLTLTYADGKLVMYDADMALISRYQRTLKDFLIKEEKIG